jgi:hemerythrin
MSVEILSFLQNWLQNHILTTDKKYSSHLQAAGIR